MIAAEISFVEFLNSSRNEEGELKELKICRCLKTVCREEMVLNVVAVGEK